MLSLFVGSRRTMLLVCAGFLVGTLAGCGPNLAPAPEGTPGSIVLTFDDGPLPADVADPASAPDPEQLLTPLSQILAKLDHRGVRAVFYIKGPGSPAAGDSLKPTFATGLQSIRQAGHVLGYHAYNHDARIWVEPLAPNYLVLQRMGEDLDQLTAFLDDVLATAGLGQEAVFTPIFRPPFGGEVIGEDCARRVAAARGWTFHGFRIDSMDWLWNADADPHLATNLHITTEDDYVAFVRGQLRAALHDKRGNATLDVLLHVNSFTAAHLDEWIDELTADAPKNARDQLPFDIPAGYLQADDLFVDLSVVKVLLADY